MVKSSLRAVDIGKYAKVGVPQGRYKPSFLFDACPRCGGTLHRTFTKESYTCFNCGYDDSTWARYFLHNSVVPSMTLEEVMRMAPHYAIPDKIELHKQDILHRMTVIGLKATLLEYGMSLSTWYNVKREWIRAGTVFPDLRKTRGGYRESDGIAARIGDISSDGATVKVSDLMTVIQREESEVSKTLESSTWSEEIRTFLQAKLDAFRKVKEKVEELARKGE